MKPVVLVLAGRDPTRGAGVDADLEALAAAGARGVAIVTNETEQDGTRVQRVDPVPIATWTAAAQRAWSVDVAAVKTGLLSSAEQVAAVADLVARWRTQSPATWVVVDPVLAASGGEVFLDAPGRARLLADLGRLGAVLTPNVPELELLVGARAGALAADTDARAAAAAELVRRGARAVLVKGGHGTEDPLVDLVVEQERVTRLVRPRLVGRRIHGSGCRFASHVAGSLALGRELAESARAAGAWLAQCLLRSPN